MNPNIENVTEVKIKKIIIIKGCSMFKSTNQLTNNISIRIEVCMTENILNVM